MFVADQDFKAGAQGGDVGSLGGRVSVDGFDGDPSDRPELPGEKMAQGTQVLRQRGVIGREVESQVPPVSLGYQEGLGYVVENLHL